MHMANVSCAINVTSFCIKHVLNLKLGPSQYIMETLMGLIVMATKMGQYSFAYSLLFMQQAMYQWPRLSHKNSFTQAEAKTLTGYLNFWQGFQPCFCGKSKVEIKAILEQFQQDIISIHNEENKTPLSLLSLSLSLSLLSLFVCLFVCLFVFTLNFFCLFCHVCLL